MTDRPITFSPPMIHALLDGRKTQTRRVLKPQPPEGAIFRAWNIGSGGHFAHFWHDPHDQYDIRLPAWRGDRLWVKEAWRTEAQHDALRPSELPDDALIYYEAEGPTPSWAGRYRNARFMLRQFCRLTLFVADVRVQRVQDISEADARAEGIEPYAGIDPDCHGFLNYSTDSADGHWIAPRESFSTLWNSIHGPDAWDRNDWVCALTFGGHRKNIGEMAA